MGDRDHLAEPIEENRAHLRAVAYRMLGSLSEADDAVQEAWLRLNRSDTTGIENLRGWLTTVVARVCLDLLRSRKSRREEPLDATDSHTEHTGRELVHSVPIVAEPKVALTRGYLNCRQPDTSETVAALEYFAKM